MQPRTTHRRTKAYGISRGWPMAAGSQAAPTGALQPGNWGASWHEQPLATLPSGGSTLVGSDGAGNFFSMRMRQSDGAGLSKQGFTPLISKIDDHNAQSPFTTATTTLLMGMCGHANSYQTGAIRNEIRIARASSGHPEDLPLDRSAQIILSLPSGEEPNYIQWHQIASGPFAGRILLFYNDDTSISWRFYFSDDDAQTWVRGRKLLRTTLEQLYIRIDPAGVFTGALPGSGYTSTFLPIYAFLNVDAGNSERQCRFCYLDLASGRIYNPSSGGAAMSPASGFDQADQDTGIVTFLQTANALNDFRVPATGRRQRVNMVRAGIGYFTDHVASTFADARHFVRKNGIDYELGLAGLKWGNSGYLPDIQPAREPHSGNRIYRAYNDGTAYNSNSKLDRIDFPNGIENGGAVTTNMLTAGVTPGIAADEAIMRIFTIDGSGPTGLVAWAWVGRYNTYLDWSGCRYVPVIL